jgi:4-hydroxymandelate oxidase
MKAKWISSREFSASPGRALSAVKRAGRVLVTSHGKPKAIMIPTSEETLASDLERLDHAEKSRVTLAADATAVPINISDYARMATGRMSKMAWAYFEGSAGDEHTARWNLEAYARIRLRPRCLVDVSKIDLRTTLLGREIPFPILVAPTAYQRLAHPGGELAMVRGANATGATMVVSTQANTPLEEVAAAATVPLWFQLYVQPDRDFTRALVRRAEAAGYKALVLTVDAPVLGTRNREDRLNFSLPPGLERANLRGLPAAKGSQRPGQSGIYSGALDPSVTWKDIDWLRSLTNMPLLLKGVMTGDDAVRGVDAGVSGIIVSNHGGRTLDTLPPTLEVLPEIVAAVAGRVPVLVDGGIRRGTDILKALGLGAASVLVGRPSVYGLAVGGADGVAHVINILRRELQSAMALTGRTSIGGIDGTVIWRPGQGAKTWPSNLSVPD